MRVVVWMWVWVLLLTHDSARHVREIRLSRSSKRKQTAELVRLIGGFLIRIRVLLQTLDTVLNLWPSKPCEEDASVVAGHMHHRRVESKVAILCQHARLVRIFFLKNRTTKSDNDGLMED